MTSFNSINNSVSLHSVSMLAPWKESYDKPSVHCMLSFQTCPTLCNPMDCSPLALLSRGFSRQEYWSGLPCPPPGDLPKPGIKPASLKSPASSSRFFSFLEKEMATHSSILAWRIPWTKEPGRLKFMGLQESDMT